MPLANSDAAILFLSCGGVLLLILLIWVIRSFLEPRVQVEPVQSLLTAGERRFYEALDEAVDGRFLILAKVRIADLFEISSSNSAARQRVFRSVASKHVDFVLASYESLQPVAAIELDDSSHERTERRLRDRMLDELFGKADFPLVRFRVTPIYKADLIEQKLEQAVALWEA